MSNLTQANELLTEHYEGTLYISGCVLNLGKFYPHCQFY